jgi:hypothetical protein
VTDRGPPVKTAIVVDTMENCILLTAEGHATFVLGAADARAIAAALKARADELDPAHASDAFEFRCVNPRHRQPCTDVSPLCGRRLA